MITNSHIEAIKDQLSAEQAAASAYSNSANEGGYGYCPHDEKIEALVTELTKAEIDELVANVDTYKVRWNAAVKQHSTNGQIKDLRAVEKEAGITMHQMKAAKARMA